jgi:hypothetical protein
LAARRSDSNLIDTGLELFSKSPTKKQELAESVAESYAHLAPSDADVALIVAHWPDLPPHSKAIILGMVRKAADRTLSSAIDQIESQTR